MSAPPAEQLELLRGGTGRRRRTGTGRAENPPTAEPVTLPVARVAVDLPLPHLDRLFDYRVPASLDDAAQPGTRVRVRFAGRDVDGFLVERVDASEHGGRLAPLRRVVSPERVLTPEVLRLARAVADGYAGTLADVLRLAVPPRHAATERETDPAADPVDRDRSGTAPGPSPWAAYPAGAAFRARLAAGDSPRAVWTALPGEEWARAVADAAAATLDSGRGTVVVVPDRRDLDLLDRRIVERLGEGAHVRLEADLGPTARYRAFLATARGRVRVVLGTRAAAFAPVTPLGLVVVWDDGDDLHAEPRAPYPHTREVLRLRAEQAGAAFLLGGWSRTAEAADLLRTGWAREIVAPRQERRAAWPRVVTAADGPGHDDPLAAAGRLPRRAWTAVHEGLRAGPVLVQVPRTGYLPGVSCRGCRRAARCPGCHGPLRLPGNGSPECGWCGRTLPVWTCPGCGSPGLRARTVGVDRTAEELGRAFPGTGVVVSRPGRVLPRITGEAVLVLATPGVEPPATEGYAAAVLLDGDALLERPDLRAGEEALRRWFAAAALVRSATAGGTVVVCADPGVAPVQALVRLDPGWHAERELEERTVLSLPPAVTAATVTGSPDAVTQIMERLRIPEGTEVLGPIPLPDPPPRPAVQPPADGALPAEPRSRVLLRARPVDRLRLAAALHEAAAARSARRESGTVRLRLDPPDIG